MNEEQKYSVIKRLVEEDGNKDRAAVELGLTRRQINRLIKKYREIGKAAFIHGNLSFRIFSSKQSNTPKVAKII